MDDTQLLPMDTQCVPSPKLSCVHIQCTSVCTATAPWVWLGELQGAGEAQCSETVGVRAAMGEVTDQVTSS